MVREMGREGKVTGSDSHKVGLSQPHVQLEQWIATVCRLIREHKHQICSLVDKHCCICQGKCDLLSCYCDMTQAKSNLLLTQSGNELVSPLFTSRMRNCRRLKVSLTDLLCLNNYVVCGTTISQIPAEGGILTFCQADELQRCTHTSHFRGSKLDCLLALWLMS